MSEQPRCQQCGRYHVNGCMNAAHAKPLDPVQGLVLRVPGQRPQLKRLMGFGNKRS